MQRWITEQFSGSSGAARKVMRKFPEDHILLSTAVTMMTTKEREPVGWSLGRFFQRRGNLVITDHRLFLESSFYSLFTLFWIGFSGYAVYLYLQERSSAFLVFLVVALLMVWQRRPYSRTIELPQVESINLGSVQGISARGDIIAVGLTEHTIQLVTARELSADLKESLSRLVPGRRAEGDRNGGE